MQLVSTPGFYIGTRSHSCTQGVGGGGVVELPSNRPIQGMLLDGGRILLLDY